MWTCPACQRNYADEIDFWPRDGTALPGLRAGTEFELNLGLSQRYRIVRKLGEGGMGSVFLAEQLALGRMVAIKVLRRRLLDDPEFLNRFQDEALSLGRISHQNVVTVHECAAAEGSSRDSTASGARFECGPQARHCSSRFEKGQYFPGAGR